MKVARSRFMLLGIVLAVVLAACGGDDSDSENAAGEGSGEPASSEGETCAEVDELTMRLNWVLDYENALYFTGIEKGYYEEACIDLNVEAGAGSTDTVKLVGNGSADIGVADAISVIAGQAQGIDVTAVGALLQSNPFGVIIRTDAVDGNTSPSIDDLYGLTFGSVEAGSPAIQWDALVRSRELDTSQIRRVNIAPPGLAEMASGQVDFVANWTMIAPVMEANDVEVAVIPGDELGQDAYGLVYTVSDSFLEENGDLVARFLTATEKAMSYSRANIEEAVGYLCDAAPENCSGPSGSSVTEEQYKLLSDLYEPAVGDTVLCIDDGRWEQTTQVVIDAEIVAEDADVEGGFTNEHLSGCA